MSSMSSVGLGHTRPAASATPEIQEMIVAKFEEYFRRNKGTKMRWSGKEWVDVSQLGVKEFNEKVKATQDTKQSDMVEKQVKLDLESRRRGHQGEEQLYDKENIDLLRKQIDGMSDKDARIFINQTHDVRKNLTLDEGGEWKLTQGQGICTKFSPLMLALIYASEDKDPKYLQHVKYLIEKGADPLLVTISQVSKSNPPITVMNSMDLLDYLDFNSKEEKLNIDRLQYDEREKVREEAEAKTLSEVSDLKEEKKKWYATGKEKKINKKIEGARGRVSLAEVPAKFEIPGETRGRRTRIDLMKGMLHRPNEKTIGSSVNNPVELKKILKSNPLMILHSNDDDKKYELWKPYNGVTAMYDFSGLWIADGLSTEYRTDTPLWEVITCEESEESEENKMRRIYTLLDACQTLQKKGLSRGFFDDIKYFVNETHRRDKSTPLMVAAYHGYTDICELLIANGAYIDKENLDGNTAMSYASTNVDMYGEKRKKEQSRGFLDVEMWQYDCQEKLQELGSIKVSGDYSGMKGYMNLSGGSEYKKRWSEGDLSPPEISYYWRLKIINGERRLYAENEEHSPEGKKVIDPINLGKPRKEGDRDVIGDLTAVVDSTNPLIINIKKLKARLSSGDKTNYSWETTLWQFKCEDENTAQKWIKAMNGVLNYGEFHGEETYKGPNVVGDTTRSIVNGDKLVTEVEFTEAGIIGITFCDDGPYVVIEEIEPDSRAGKAGLKPNLRLMQFQGQKEPQFGRSEGEHDSFLERVKNTRPLKMKFEPASKEVIDEMNKKAGDKVKDEEKTTRDKRVEEHNAAIQQRARMEKQGRNPIFDA